MNPDAPHFQVHVAEHNLAQPQTATCPHCHQPQRIINGHFEQHKRYSPMIVFGHPPIKCPGSGTAPFGGQPE